MIMIPPEIATTVVAHQVQKRFFDEDANMNSVLLGDVRRQQGGLIRFVEVLPDPQEMPAPQPSTDASEPHDSTSYAEMATANPKALLALVAKGTLPVHELTFAAEALGRLEGVQLAVELLKKLVHHTSPVVREGAVYGLACHVSDHAVAELLTDLARNDPSRGVREAAAEALDA